MADDILEFCHEQALQHISLLGHSMCVPFARTVRRTDINWLAIRGGKVAMSVALDPHLPENLLSHLIVADIAPSKGPLSSEFQGYLDGMIKIEESNVTTRAEAQTIMKQYEPVCLSALRFRSSLLILLISVTGPRSPRIPAH